jgi:hypothetical protein
MSTYYRDHGRHERWRSMVHGDLSVDQIAQREWEDEAPLPLVFFAGKVCYCSLA